MVERNNHGKAGSLVNRRKLLGTLGTGVIGLSGCLNGNTNQGGSNGQETTPTEAAKELSPEEWRKKAAEEAEKELEGDEKVMWVNEIRDKKTLKLIGGEYPGVYDVLSNNVEAFTGRTTELRSKYVEEQRSGIKNMDVITLHVTPLAEQGVEFSDISDIPAWKKQPDELKDAPYFGAFNMMPFSVFYNTDLVSEPPKSWDDLLSDRFANKKTTIDVTPNYIVAGTVMYKLKSKEYIKNLFENELKTLDSGFKITQTVAKGNGHATLMGVVSHALEFNDAGLSIDVIENPDFWIFWRMPVAMAKEPAHPWAASLLADYIMRTDHEQATKLQSTRPGTLAPDMSTASSQIVADMFEQGDKDVRVLSDFDRSWSELEESYQSIAEQYK